MTTRNPDRRHLIVVFTEPPAEPTDLVAWRNKSAAANPVFQQPPLDPPQDDDAA